MDNMQPMLSETLETLTDWFETIEEVELNDSSREKLMEIAESVSTSKSMALEMGVHPEDFDEWFQFNVLEQWSALLEDMDLEENTDMVQLFYGFTKEGEERLYLQMLKQCLPMADSQSA